MWLRMFLILTTTFHLNCAQDSVYFPQEIEDSQHIESGPLVPANINLTEIRGTNVYEKYVERVITGGITKLTLAVNKVLLQGTSTGSHNIVFAPISIAGKKMKSCKLPILMNSKEIYFEFQCYQHFEQIIDPFYDTPRYNSFIKVKTCTLVSKCIITTENKPKSGE